MDRLLGGEGVRGVGAAVGHDGGGHAASAGEPAAPSCRGEGHGIAFPLRGGWRVSDEEGRFGSALDGMRYL